MGYILVWTLYYIPTTRPERISDTVEFFYPKYKIPKMVFTDAYTHTSHDLMYTLQNPAPEIPLVTLRNYHTSDLRDLVGIFDRGTPRSIPTRVVPPEIKWQHQLIIE